MNGQKLVYLDNISLPRHLEQFVKKTQDKYIQSFGSLLGLYPALGNELLFKGETRFIWSLKLISDFFVKGKQTESGGVEPLIIENLNVFNKENAACLCFIAKYKSFPIPVVRSTLYLELIDGKWKIVHAHCSFQP